MTLFDLTGKKVAILGFGREGKAVLDALKRLNIPCDVTVLDASPDTKAEDCTVVTGPEYLAHLSAFDVIVKSPGIPPKPEIDAVQERITTGTRLFFETVKPSGALIIGITGSKGKSTTTTLIHQLLQAGGLRAELVGNIGVPALSRIREASPKTIFVHELSSYQLMDLTVSPKIAVVTSFFPEHLDYHGSLEAYLEAKKHITRFQTEDDVVFFAADSHGAADIAKEGEGRKIPFSPADAPVNITETQLIGEHNLSNIAAAYKVARELGVNHDVCVKVIKAFRGLPHRLQFLGSHHGVDWVDDAISTTPESAMAALEALEGKVSTIILGGQDRGVDFEELGRAVVEANVKTVILFPGSGPRIRKALEAADTTKAVKIFEAGDMPAAVSLAKEHTEPGKVCLLSTASPSYGMFKNFEEKGEKFKEYIVA